MIEPLNLPREVRPFFQAVVECFPREIEGWSDSRVEAAAYGFWARSLSNRSLTTRLQALVLSMPIVNASEITAVLIEVKDRLMRNPRYNRRLKLIRREKA